MSKTKVIAVMPKRQQSNVNIKKVNNGFVVSGYKGDWEKEKTFIAKNQKEAKKIASKLL
jgi:hypothetical protein